MYFKTDTQFKTFRLSELNPATYNPRQISDSALAGLSNSLKRFGCVEPIIINVRGGKNTIVGGHQRHKALLAMHGGDYECACVVVDLGEADEKLLNLSLNNPEIQGDFIDNLSEYIERLRGEISEQDYLDLQIDKLAGEIEEEKTGNIQDDDIPDSPKEVVTRLGDLWVLGEHRLLCGDSTKKDDVDKLMNGEKASLFATDPPYCVDYTGADRPKQPVRAVVSDWPPAEADYGR